MFTWESLEDDDPGDAINLINCTGEEWDKSCQGVEESLLQYAAHQPDPELYRMMRQVDSGLYTVGASARCLKKWLSGHQILAQSTPNPNQLLNPET